MDKEEADRLSEELWELSEFEQQNFERMKEIAHVLVAYYMWWKQNNAWDAEKKSAENDLESIAWPVEI